MAKDEWFRRTTWTTEDEISFQSRLKRSRGDDSKAQYLRIQAYHLAQVGNHQVALLLLDQLFQNHSVRSELASSYLQRAISLTALDRDQEAIVSFRAAMDVQMNYPNVRTAVALDFAWFIVVRRHVALYDEVQSLLGRFKTDVGLMFAKDRFRCAVVSALLAQDRGQQQEARAFAAEARVAAGETHSGFRNHARVGLVGNIPKEVAARLSAIDDKG